MTHKILIVEDEPYIRKALITLINNFEKNLTVSGECGSVKEAIIVAKATKPDVILLDINLQDGTGFDILKQISKLNFKLIFITAYEEYALQAIKNGAIDYILKPIDAEELENALNKAITSINPNTHEQFTVINDHIEGKKNRIVLSLQNGYQIIYLSELIYCQSDAGYTKFHLINNKSFVASKPIKAFEEQLPKSQFIRTHQSYIINKNFIERLDKTRFIVLKNGKSIPVSVRKMNTVITKLFK